MHVHIWYMINSYKYGVVSFDKALIINCLSNFDPEGGTDLS